MVKINDLNLKIATQNGTGSQSSNNILLKTIFRMGVPSSGKNLFPSNIFGLPTWYHIRANADNFTSFQEKADILVSMNLATLADDIQSLKSGGIFIYNEDLKFDHILLRDDTINFGVPFKDIVNEITSSIKLKKLIANMVYVGIIAEIINIDKEILMATVADNFKEKQSVIDLNQNAVTLGINYAKDHFSSESKKFQLQNITKTKNEILIDGNTAGALGAVFGGCSFASWYPITPSSSIMEQFQHYSESFRSKNGKNDFAIIQAEDELASIGMVIGASWAGARAMTATSGPGMSLMSEFVGLSYFAEIPSVIWDIQRVGPSTGLPTRTMQGDLQICHRMGHGDSRHPVLIPSNPTECFEYGQLAFDIAERIQSFVCVLSDLDLGMNHWPTNEFNYPTKTFDRGKVLDKEALEQIESFARYKDVDGDAIPYRTLPGTHNEKAPYFTRGTGHDEKSTYSENPQTYENLMKRLQRKQQTVKQFLPKPYVDQDDNNKIGLIAYGTTDQAIEELRHELKNKNIHTNYLCIKALPLVDEITSFIEKHEQVFVLEQNRDAQMTEIIMFDHPQHASKIKAILSFDGLPARSEKFLQLMEGVL